MAGCRFFFSFHKSWRLIQDATKPPGFHRYSQLFVSYRVSHRAKFVSRASKRSLLKDFAASAGLRWEFLAFFRCGSRGHGSCTGGPWESKFCYKPYNPHWNKKKNPRQCDSSDPHCGGQHRSCVTIFSSLNNDSDCHYYLWFNQSINLFVKR